LFLFSAKFKRRFLKYKYVYLCNFEGNNGLILNIFRTEHYVLVMSSFLSMENLLLGSPVSKRNQFSRELNSS